MKRLLCKVCIWLLNHVELDNASKALLLNALIRKTIVLPIHDIFAFDIQGGVKVNNKALTVEQAVQIREGAVSLKANTAYKLIKDQIAFLAVNMGVHNSLSLDMVLGAKMALWIQEREMELIEKLSGEK